MKLTVEIHDVTPAMAREVEIIRAALAKIGVERMTLLVVPAFEDRAGRVWDLREHPRMVEWLREEQARGSEVVLHGLTHRAPARPPPGAKNWVMFHWVSRGCAEFAHLDRDEAARRVRRGRRIFAECGLATCGFIAPAWAQSAAVREVIAGSGFRFTAFMRNVVRIGEDGACTPVRTPVLTFAAAMPAIDYGKRAYMRAVEAASTHRSLLRIALHPEDVHGARPLAHAIARIRALLEHRELATYNDWLAGTAVEPSETRKEGVQNELPLQLRASGVAR